MKPILIRYMIEVLEVLEIDFQIFPYYEASTVNSLKLFPELVFCSAKPGFSRRLWNHRKVFYVK